MAKDKLIQKWDLKSRVSALLLNDLMSDVVFEVDNPPQKFPCHKVILGVGCHVFETMFFGQIPEKSPILVPDVTATGFEIMLRYLYSDVIALQNEADAYETAYVAKKYLMETLFKACEHYLLKNATLNSQTVFLIYEEACFLEMEKLQALCVRYFSRNARKILRSKSLLGASSDTLKALLKRDLMIIDSECDVIEAVLSWGEEQCRIRDQDCSMENISNFTKDLMKYVRFSSLDAEELEKTFSKFKLADNTKSSDLLCKFTGSKTVGLPHISSEVSSTHRTRSITNCSRIEMPTKYVYDGNMSTFSTKEHCQKASITVSGPDVTFLGFVVAFKSIACYSSIHRCIDIELIVCNTATNEQSRTKSLIKAEEDNIEQFSQELVLDDFVVIAEGEVAELMAIVSGEGVRIMECMKDSFSCEVGKSRITLSFSAEEEPILLPIKDILCKPS